MRPSSVRPEVSKGTPPAQHVCLRDDIRRATPIHRYRRLARPRPRHRRSTAVTGPCRARHFAPGATRYARARAVGLRPGRSADPLPVAARLQAWLESLDGSNNSRAALINNAALLVEPRPLREAQAASLPWAGARWHRRVRTAPSRPRSPGARAGARGGAAGKRRQGRSCLAGLALCATTAPAQERVAIPIDVAAVVVGGRWSSGLIGGVFRVVVRTGGFDRLVEPRPPENTSLRQGLARRVRWRRNTFQSGRSQTPGLTPIE